MYTRAVDCDSSATMDSMHQISHFQHVVEIGFMDRIVLNLAFLIRNNLAGLTIPLFLSGESVWCGWEGRFFKRAYMYICAPLCVYMHFFHMPFLPHTPRAWPLFYGERQCFY